MVNANAIESGHRTVKLAQWVKALAIKPNSLRVIPRTQMVEEETQLPEVVL